MRRRFEINEGIVGWGQARLRRRAASRRHTARLAWSVPGGGTRWVCRARPCGSARDPAGQLGPGPDRRVRFGAEPDRRHRPVAPRDRDPGRSIRHRRAAPRAVAPLDAGSGVVVAAITAFRGTSPLALEPRRTLRVEDDAGVGSVGDSARCSGSVRLRPDRGTDAASPGDRRVGAPGPTMARQRCARRPRDGGGRDDRRARQRFGRSAAGRWLPPAFSAPSRSRSLPAGRSGSTSRWIDALTGEPVPSRVRFEAADRPLPPTARTPRRDQLRPERGHRRRSWCWAGRPTPTFRVASQSVSRVGVVQVEVVRGFGYRARSDIGRCRQWSGTAGPAIEPVDGPSGTVDLRRHPRPFHPRRRRRSSRREPKA